MVITDGAKMPGVIVKGKEQPKEDRPQAGLALMDARGKERIQLKVPADGTPEIDFLDADGKLIKVIKGEASISQQ